MKTLIHSKLARCQPASLQKHILSHMLLCVNSFIKYKLFHDKNNTKLFQRKETLWLKNFEKNSKKKMLGLYNQFKRAKQIQKLLTFSKLFTEVVIFAAANTFFNWLLYVLLTVAPDFVPESFKLVLLPGLPYLITYNSGSNCYFLISLS